VLKAPDADAKATGRDTKDLTIRVTADQAAQLAFAADAGRVWFILRPPVGAKNPHPSSVTLEALLAGAPTIEVGR
jgi:Flp pilus assembly protein CpaB